MADKAWKQRERAVAKLIGGERVPADLKGAMPGLVDVESDRFIGQVKEVAALPLAELTRLVVGIEAEATKVGKAGVVFVKLRAGRGVTTPLLVVQSEASWRALKCSCTRSSSSAP